MSARPISADDHRNLIERFYRALQQRDGATMAGCYHGSAKFRDPVFELAGADIGKMWRMLCTHGEDLRVEFANLSADACVGRADWQAWYTFKSSARPVHNVIHASFRFADGLIVEHIDHFDFWRWSRQAIGPAGWLLGWSPLVRTKVRAEAVRALERFSG
jgi:hypothetical protein